MLGVPERATLETEFQWEFDGKRARQLDMDAQKERLRMKEKFDKAEEADDKRREEEELAKKEAKKAEMLMAESKTPSYDDVEELKEMKKATKKAMKKATKKLIKKK